MKSFVTKLLPEQVTVFWNVVKFAIEQSLPPINITNVIPNKQNSTKTKNSDGSHKVTYDD